MTLAAHSCSDLSLVKESLDGCSKPSTVSMDPGDIPVGAEDWLSTVSMEHGYPIDGPRIGIGVLDLELILEDTGSGSSALVEEKLGFDLLGKEDLTSKGGPDTRT